ncbi:MAG: hypothetical protein A2161_20730 [Candidatus Schekmanbacteria bacterium RBG_13_48_7]|uniref:Uncharacterized protein n=1 Tax=Candidatus Schekmanbacteria bacterium RBG_13_48_7 TaxID=1817878 RepID=A0A1F7RZC2_9BACT|nr:MAG: hypothetical protein A2161_20730 [Candidatus Schekmanbacteria bacterium RBG_13_48_7]
MYFVIRGDRQNPTLIKLDLKSTLKECNLGQNFDFINGDIVFVPPSVISSIAKFASYVISILYPVLLFESEVIKPVI